VHGQEMAQAASATSPIQSLAMIAAFLKAGADVNSRDEYGSTALSRASYRGNKDLVKLLLAQPGIKLDQTNVDGETALMMAAENGHAEIVDMLLKAGADVSLILGFASQATPSSSLCDCGTLTGFGGLF